MTLAIGYTFKDKALLSHALTHPSLAGRENNQRLEFLGDAVLGAIVAKLLYFLYPNENEGSLARRKAALVNGATLAKIAEESGLGSAMHMAASEAGAGGRSNPSNLEDACEALIGALFLDGGLEAAEAFIRPRFEPLARQSFEAPKDAKTSLQEWAQARGLPVPSYTLVSSEGVAHAPVFTIRAEVEGGLSATAKAKSKRAAEQEAARQLLAQVEGNP